MRRNNTLNNLTEGSSMVYPEYRFLRTICYGFLQYRKKEKKQSLYGFWRLVAQYRSGFLRFLWCLWYTSIPNFHRTDIRKIEGVQTEMEPLQLYYHMIDYFSECVNHIVFCSHTEIKFRQLGKSVTVPSRWSKFIAIFIFPSS